MNESCKHCFHTTSIIQRYDGRTETNSVCCYCGWQYTKVENRYMSYWDYSNKKHGPYNPDKETPLLFLDDRNHKSTYDPELRHKITKIYDKMKQKYNVTFKKLRDSEIGEFNDD